MKRYLLTGAALIALATAGCSTDAGQSAPAITTTTVTTVAAPSTVTSAATVAATTDKTVCGSLEKTGRAFYEQTYSAVMKKQRVTTTPVQLAAQLGVLSATGAPDGSIDGSAAIDQASPDVRLKLSTMVRDALQIAQRFADAATGAVTSSDITPIVNSFTSALVACSKAGFEPSWFNPEDLVG